MSTLGQTATHYDYYDPTRRRACREILYLDKIPVHSTSTTSLPREKDLPIEAAVPCSNPLRSLRPSLSQQLLSIQNLADDITRSLQSKYSRSPDVPLLSLPASTFSVGKLSARYPSVVHFFQDRCEYLFFHPFESSQIRMVMYYRHMEELSIRHSKIQFRILKDLIHFMRDYDPRNRRHCIQIILAGESGVDDVKRIIGYRAYRAMC